MAWWSWKAGAMGLGFALLSVQGAWAGGRFAYFTDSSGDYGFLNIKTGVATVCGYESATAVLNGIGVGKFGVVYGGVYDGVIESMAEGATPETQVSSSGRPIYDMGSDHVTTYLATRRGDLFRLNPQNGHSTLVGRFGFSLDGGTLSNGLWGLYLTTGSSLYFINYGTYVPTLIGDTGRIIYGLGFVGKTLYGTAGLTLYTLNLQSGAATSVANITGITAENIYGLAQVPLVSSDSCLTAAWHGHAYRPALRAPAKAQQK